MALSYLHQIVLRLFVLPRDQLLSQLLQLDPLLVSLHDGLESGLFGGRHLTRQVVNVDVLLDGDLAVAEDGEEGRFPGTVFAEKSVALAARELELGVVEEFDAMKRDREVVDLDIT